MKKNLKKKFDKYSELQTKRKEGIKQEKEYPVIEKDNHIKSIHNNEATINRKAFIANLLTIRTKFILVFMLPVILIVILGVLSYSLSSKGLIGSYESSTMSNMSNMVRYLNFGFDSVTAKANILNSNKTVQYYYSDFFVKEEAKARFKEIQDLFNTNVLSEEYIADIYIFANYGEGISSNGPLNTDIYSKFITNSEGIDLYENNVETAWIGNHTYLDSLTRSSGDDYAISYISSLHSITNEQIGYIVLDVTSDYVKDTLTGSGLPDGSVIAFITGDGREIINGDVTDNFKFIEQSYYSKAIKSEESSGFEYVNYMDKDYLFVYSKVASGDSLLCAVIPEDVIIKEASMLKNITIIIVIVASIIAIAFGTFMASDFSNTIHKTIKILQKTASGDLTYTTSIKRRDEFRILGISINEMISSMTGLIRKMTSVSETVSESSLIVSESSNILVSATQNISEAVGNIEQGVTQQAEDAESCLFQMADLAERINAVYINTNNIGQIASNTKVIVENGIIIIDDLGHKVKNTTNITRTVIEDIESLEKESHAINGIIGAINEIAEQTNLLSLNASIEAARAGNAGRGFSVVAEEIRKLADQSLNASNEIKKIINKIESQTKKTAITARYAESIVLSQEEALNSTVNVFAEINKHVENLTDNLNQIASGVEGIEHAKEDTLGAIESISATSEETAAAAGQLGVTAEEQLKEVNKLNDVVKQLSDDAKNLEKTVSVFKVI
ncbi:MAG: methyl-accepting chemotaxis sensory transducer [Anaerocolumna sp.]|jgi:methyl-accepting chemotaxis protein|nr:methyl-accepting chemotaxis sensory transducer [Anaerocolumna sp.]